MNDQNNLFGFNVKTNDQCPKSEVFLVPDIPLRERNGELQTHDYQFVTIKDKTYLIWRPLTENEKRQFGHIKNIGK
jgi:hypothetical protein